MGYDLHITRREDWTDETGPEISLEEWNELVERHSATDVVRGALYWERGEVIAKNPDVALVRQMVAMAERLGGRVQGDDGEIYDPDGTAQRGQEPQPARPANLFSSAANWLRSRRSARDWQADQSQFVVGSRVRDARGRRGVVIQVDRVAEQGMGRFRVRFDDGVEVAFALIAPGVEVEKSGGSE